MLDDLFWGVLLVVCLFATASLYIFAIVSVGVIATVGYTGLFLWRWIKHRLNEFIDWIENGMYLP